MQVERDEAALVAAKKSWRLRRRIKRLLIGWFLVALIFAEAGASWFGIMIARNAPMSLAQAKHLGEVVSIGVLVVSFLLLILMMSFQFKAQQRLRRIEKIHAERTGTAAAVTVSR